MPCPIGLGAPVQSLLIIVHYCHLTVFSSHKPNTRKSACKDWPSGDCQFKNGCHFHHQPELRGTDPNAYRSITNKSQRTCNNWASGTCKKEQCEYRHDQSERGSAIKSMMGEEIPPGGMYWSYIYTVLFIALEQT